MKVLFATSEAHPLAKTGGLADVSGALPAALQDVGVDARILMPGYPSALEKAENLSRVFRIDLPNHGETALLRGTFPGLGFPVYLIEHAGYYQREGLYQDKNTQDWQDNALRFGLLSQFAAWMSGPKSPVNFTPDILHCNDWQTGLAPAYLHFEEATPIPSVFTIHNIAYQGIFSPEVIAKLGLPKESFSVDGLEYYGNLSFLKAGLNYATRITTVSPNYAKEIQTEAFGMGFQGLLSARKSVLHGILNGIDTREWNPATDPHLYTPYSFENLAGKSSNKLSLQGELGMQCNAKTPLLGMVSRMAHQKGSDVVIEAAPKLLQMGAQLVVLGNGEQKLEAAWRKLANANPGQVAVFIGYDEGLAHRIEAGADMFLMPSRFEPCGLNQMYSLRYGTIPVVTRVGGLADTVIHASQENLNQGKANGFVIDHLDKNALAETINRALILFRHKLAWQKLMTNGMKKDFGWGKSAHQYLDLYREMLKVS